MGEPLAVRVTGELEETNQNLEYLETRLFHDRQLTQNGSCKVVVGFSFRTLDWYSEIHGRANRQQNENQGESHGGNVIWESSVDAVQEV